MLENKAVVANVIPMMTEIMGYILNGFNYLDQSKIALVYLWSVGMHDNVLQDPLADGTLPTWMREYTQSFLQTHNSINSEVIGFINHYEFPKELE